MTPKEKAPELVNKFIPHTKVFNEVLGWEDYIDPAIRYALLAVDEILKVIHTNMEDRYWQEVKQEIEKL